MTRKTPTKTAPEPSWPFDYNDMLAGGEAGMRTVVEANRTFLDGMSAMTDELGRFVTARLQEDAGATRSLMSCRTPEEAMNVQLSFAQTATRQYFEEAGRLMALAMDMASTHRKPLEAAAQGEGKGEEDAPAR